MLGPSKVDGSGQVLLEWARRMFSAAKSFAPRATDAGGAFITVQDSSGGDFGLSGLSNGNAWVAGVPGLVKTVAQEWPRASSVKAIDLERGS